VIALKIEVKFVWLRDCICTINMNLYQCYRSHPLSVQMNEATELGLSIIMLRVGNLSCLSVKSLVADILRMEDHEDQVESLAAIIHKKTAGNAFYVLMFLRSLYDEELIRYNFGVMRWLWDDDVVKKKLITQNVATIMLQKLKRLNEFEQLLVKIASCIAANVCRSVLAIVIESFGHERASSKVTESMQKLEDEGLWESTGEDSYRFAHDQIQMAAFNLIPPDQRNSFGAEIGDILLNKLDPDTLEKALFQVVALKNLDVLKIREGERRDLARLNRLASVKAFDNAAFDTAVIYSKEARELMGPKAWECDNDTMVELCSKEAQARFITGDIKTMEMLIREVMSKEIPIKKKFLAIEVKIRAAQGSGRFDEAINTCFEVLKQLGFQTRANKPASTFAIWKEYHKTNRMINGLSAEEIAELPELKDETVVMGQRLLEFLQLCTLQAQPTLKPLITFMGVQTSVKYGINDSTISFLNSFGAMLCGTFGQFQRGREIAKAVGLILKKPNMKHKKSRGIFGQEIIKLWGSPLQASLQPLLEGYQMGLKVGDMEAAGIDRECTNA